MRYETINADFRLTRPGTDHPLAIDGRVARGPECTWTCDERGIWQMIRPERRDVFDRFATDYAQVRTAEGRARSPEAVRALPYRDLSGEMPAQWAERAKAFDHLLDAVAGLHPSSMLDVGAGCGWAAARLADKGWAAAAIDVTVDGGDGLAAAVHHDQPLLLVRAEMEALPFASGTIGLALINAALHYAGDVGHALDEAWRVLAPRGILAVMDSPVYVDRSAGERMVREFEQKFAADFAMPVAEHLGQGFVANDDLDAFSQRHDTAFEQLTSNGVVDKVRAWVGARRAGREIAARPLLLAHKSGGDEGRANKSRVQESRAT